MAPPPPPAFQDLGALVLDDDALDLQQQIVLRAGSNRTIEENHRGWMFWPAFLISAACP